MGIKEAESNEPSRSLERYASGASPAPACPCCGHVESVYALAEYFRAPRRSPYGRIFDIFNLEANPNIPSRHPIVTGGLHDLGYATPALKQQTVVARGLGPPRRPASPWQRLDRRIALIVDLAFAGLALLLFGSLVRAAELIGVAVILGAVAVLAALWLALALATGRFRRTSDMAQAIYERALRRWRALFYCEDCGSVFRRDRRGYLRPEAVPDYLRRDGDDTIDPAMVQE